MAKDRVGGGRRVDVRGECLRGMTKEVVGGGLNACRAAVCCFVVVWAEAVRRFELTGLCGLEHSRLCHCDDGGGRSQVVCVERGKRTVELDESDENGVVLQVQVKRQREHHQNTGSACSRM